VLDKVEMTSHWFKGGFPDSLLTNDKISRIWQKNFISTYIERDLPMLGFSSNPDLTRRLWTMLAHMHGSVLNTENLSKSLGVSAPTIKKYISFLEGAFLITILKPFHSNIKKRLVKSPKIYIRDSGILHSLLNIQSYNDLLGHIIIGASWEGYVVEQIIQTVKEEYECYFYRTHQGAECDLVLAKSGVPVISMKIKFSSAPNLTKGFANSISDLKTKQNYIITPSSDNFKLRKDVEVICLEDFLKNII
jgi:predicted AAA+ superfamily ATPase